MAAVITTSGKVIALNRTFLASPTMTSPSQFKVGVGTTAPAVADTDLESAIPQSGSEQVDSCDSVGGWTDSTDMTIALNTTTFKEGTGALDLTKDGTSSVDASTEKTVTSYDFTSKTLSFFLYIIDATALAKLATTDCLTIRYGSDNSNYYEWTFDNADLSTGWNVINNMTSANAGSTTGSPVIASSDYFFIQLTATGTGITWSDGDIIMDDIVIGSADDYLKNYVSGFPTIDTVNGIASTRMFLNTLEANNYDLTEIGTFNTDGTPVLFGRSTFPTISKTNLIEVTFIEKDLIV